MSVDEIRVKGGFVQLVRCACKCQIMVDEQVHASHAMAYAQLAPLTLAHSATACRVLWTPLLGIHVYWAYMYTGHTLGIHDTGHTCILGIP